LLFDTVHYVLCLVAVRADMGDEFDRVSTQHPFGCWLSSMMTCFAGGILTAPLCGEPLLEGLTEDPKRLMIATALWFALFYLPKDTVYNLVANTKAVKIPLYAMKGMYYPKKILGGIKHAKFIFKKNPIAGIVIATLKGNGSGIIKPFARLARGKWSPEAFESVRPSVTTKYMLLCASLYTVYPSDMVYLLMTGVLLYMKVAPLFDVDVDFFAKAEDKITPVVFGQRQKKD